MRNIVQKIESMVQGKRLGNQEEAAPHPLLKMESSLSLDDEPPPGQPDERRKNDQLLKSSESIQRAIKDIYRTATLLHNFSIMNYTGFVKIVKKHDKGLPDLKGAHFSLTGVTRFHDGAESTALCGKMER